MNPWEKQERRLAKLLKGKVNAGSGSFWSRKGDVRNEKFVVEAKYTDTDKYPIRLSVLQKIEEEGFLTSRIPYLAIHCGGIDWVVIHESYVPRDNLQLATHLIGVRSVTLYAGRMYTEFLRPMADGAVPYAALLISGNEYLLLLEDSFTDLRIGDRWTTNPSTPGDTVPSA